MEKNVGGVDRILRIIVGLGFDLNCFRWASHTLGLDRRYPASDCPRELLSRLSVDWHEHLLARLELRTAVSFG